MARVNFLAFFLLSYSVSQCNSRSFRLWFENPATEPPTAHLLSNGNYGVMLTATGEGFSRWRDLAITRWRSESAQAALGSFLFLRDTGTGEVWSAGVQPTPAGSDHHRAVFCEHHAAFTHHMPRLTTLTEVVVSAEDDAKARRVTLTNSGRRVREIDVTSYAELVLAPPSADLAHPAFSKMFVVTDYLPRTWRHHRHPPPPVAQRPRGLGRPYRRCRRRGYRPRSRSRQTGPGSSGGDGISARPR